MKAYRIFSLIVLSSLFLAACGGAATTATADPNTIPPVIADAGVISQGRLYPKQFADISFNASGKVAEVIAREGDAVQANDLIARLESTEAEETAVARAQKAANVARAQEEVVAAQLEIVAAQQGIVTAQQELVNAQKAVTDMVASTATALNLAQLQTDIANLQKQIDDANRNLRYLVSPDVKWYQDQVARAQDSLTMTVQTANLTDLQMAVTAAKDAVAQRQIDLQDAINLDGWGGSKLALEAKKNYDLAVDTLKNAELRLAQAQIANDNSITDAQKSLDDATKALNNILTGPDAIKVSQAQANIALLQAQLAKAQSDLEKLKTTSGLDQDQLRLAQDRVVTAQNGAVAAQNRVTAAQTRLTTAQANLIAVQMKSDSVELKAPFAGTISVQNLKVGEHINAGQPMVTLVDFSQWEVKTDDLTEIEVVKIKEGQNVTVKLDALPDVTLTGVVMAISSKYEEKRGDITYTVTIALTSTDPRMRWGMTADVTFEK